MVSNACTARRREKAGKGIDGWMVSTLHIYNTHKTYLVGDVHLDVGPQLLLQLGGLLCVFGVWGAGVLGFGY